MRANVSEGAAMRAIFTGLTRLDSAVLRPAAGLALLVIMFAISLNALSRGFLNISIGWVIPLVTSLAMPAAVFFGLPALTLGDGHVRMEALSDKFPRSAQIQFRRLGWVVGIVVLGYIGYANAVTAWERRRHAIAVESIVPASYQYGIVAGSCLLTALILLVYLIRPGLMKPVKSDIDDAASDV